MRAVGGHDAVAEVGVGRGRGAFLTAAAIDGMEGAALLQKGIGAGVFKTASVDGQVRFVGVERIGKHRG